VRNHKYKWYMTSRLITMNDIYSFDPNANVNRDDAAPVVCAGAAGFADGGGPIRIITATHS
jgi:hypothetical protein